MFVGCFATPCMLPLCAYNAWPIYSNVVTAAVLHTRAHQRSSEFHSTFLHNVVMFPYDSASVYSDKNQANVLKLL